MSNNFANDFGGSAFQDRHIGPTKDELSRMLEKIGLGSMDELTKKAVPVSIQFQGALDIKPGASEQEALEELKGIAKNNQVFKSFIGMGYANCYVPSVIQRNILENPGWYTQYTPYQAEISQGRMEALLNFQTMIMDLTGLDIANASLLDEPTAAAEAMALCLHMSESGDKEKAFFVANNCHPQTIDVIRTRANALSIPLIVASPSSFDPTANIFGVLLQYPDTDGGVFDHSEIIAAAKKQGAMVVMAVDLLALALLKDPGAMGADIAIGSAQRFGVPMGFGGPHAAFFATRDEFKRKIPGRIIGVSKDAEGKPAMRLALQTREQHIRREKATSNICTAQALLANMAGMFAVYHGPEGIKAIAQKVHHLTCLLADALVGIGFRLAHHQFFDTIKVLVDAKDLDSIQKRAVQQRMNLRYFAECAVGISLDETTTIEDVKRLVSIFGPGLNLDFDAMNKRVGSVIPLGLVRDSKYLQGKVFQEYHSETEMMRYIKRLEQRDLSLTSAMIPLGSCTMKLNAASELYPISWPEFSQMHPFVPQDQSLGYQQMFQELQGMLCEITGFDAVSLQPNSGAQGEYAGLLVIKSYHEARGESHRDVCLIPSSAHGTNPASAIMAGYKVVVTKCDSKGNIDIADLKEKTEQYRQTLAAIMITYPSTHGVFEAGIRELCELVHSCGGQVYMDGANLNAQVGLCRPGDFGPDVCHMNLHKTFCIPHGGGGPGMGPIAVKKHLSPYLPGHVQFRKSPDQACGAVSGAPYGSASILPISWMYIRMMGPDGLKKATQVAILNANYVAARLKAHYPILYCGDEGLVAHECIIDLRPLKASAGIEVDDVAKRLIDFGFHAPTVSFPVAGTMMIEPTESESKKEIDRFCDAMIAIREEIRVIEQGKMDRQNNPLKNAPHTATALTQEEWSRPYSREQAIFPNEHSRLAKFWPYVARVDNAYGDRNLVCSCAPIEDYL